MSPRTRARLWRHWRAWKRGARCRRTSAASPSRRRCYTTWRSPPARASSRTGASPRRDTRAWVSAWRGRSSGEATAGCAAPLPARETICALVRFHGLPLWLLDKADPVRAAVEASPRARLDLVALVAEADVRGRIAADRDALLERVALFRAFCEEWGCLRAPYAFASDHARFVYFHERKADPAYAAYDDTTFEVILMSGLPGAGKDTWIARNHPDLPVVSLDRIRRELKVAPDEDQGAVAQAAKARARELLRRHEPFIWNATNVTRALRGQLVDLFASYGARVRIVYVEAPHAELLRRNERREASVPGPVIAKLARKLEIPDLTEAQTVEWVWEE